MIIRKMKESDFSIVANLEKKYIDYPWNEQMLKSAAENENEMFVACDGDLVVAYGSYSVAIDEASVNNIAVDLNYRNKGIGKLLVEYIIDNCKKGSVKRIFLEVSADNYPAINLYSKYEFRIINLRRKYYGNTDALIMKLEFMR